MACELLLRHALEVHTQILRGAVQARPKTPAPSATSRFASSCDNLPSAPWGECASNFVMSGRGVVNRRAKSLGAGSLALLGLFSVAIALSGVVASHPARATQPASMLQTAASIPDVDPHEALGSK